MEWRLETYAKAGSTSDICLSRAASGESEGLAVLALQQTKGRGSRGRSWLSPPGNLSLSVLLRPNASLLEAGEWPLRAGLALSDALLSFLPDPASLTVKWPNDLLLRGRKLAGILIDTISGPDRRIAALVLGFGVNLAVAPEIEGRATASLAGEGLVPPAPESFAPILLDRLASRCNEGFPSVRAAWLERAHPLGTRLKVIGGGLVLEGKFAGLDGAGHLLLETPAGVQAISAGEVLLGTE
ncbi:MAG: biotin--[acetyl-CoA-carboxylase] ligase [Acetobacteraceae bacterium]|nr:biotin--[acetyl-CoA-carboxylase] ligase [Acetobacteraceae bacterium]